MQQNYFADKNILYLLPTNENQYLNFHINNLKMYVKNILTFNTYKHIIDNGIKNTEKNIKQSIIENNIDIIIVSPFPNDYGLSMNYYASLKDIVKIVFWMWDDEMYFDSYSKYYCQIADAVITTDYFSVIAYNKLCIPAILFLPTHSRRTYYPLNIEKDIDVSFLGDCTKNDRMQYIDYLIKNGVNVETFGNGSKNGFVERSEISKIYSRSKINLNLSKLDNLNWINKDEPLLNRIRTFKGRIDEICLTKSFVLSEYAPNLKFYFDTDTEIAIFDTKEELLDKICYYLTHNEEREKIALNGYKRAIDNYVVDVTIQKTLYELYTILYASKKQNLTYERIYLSQAFKVKSINGLTFTMFVIIKNKKILYALELFKGLFKYGFFIFLAGFYGGLVRAIKRYGKYILCKFKIGYNLQ